MDSEFEYVRKPILVSKERKNGNFERIKTKIKIKDTGKEGIP